ncbi:two-component sensor histidine kinase, partial [Mesorhizobium sp. M7A.F.Ca.US.001.02.1.1]
KIGSDGVLAAVPEVGSAEVKATAHALNQLSSRLRTAMESRMRVEFLDDERDKWLHDLDELDRIADSAIRLVREEVNQDAVEAVDL